MLVYLLVLALCVPVAGVAVLVLAGPHADLLPQPLAVAVLPLAVLAVLLLPAWVARRVWRRASRAAAGAQG